MKRSLNIVGGVLAGSLLFAASSAHAHIKLLKPTSWLKDDATGGAQEKGGPCGPGDYDAILGNTDTPSGVVTTFQAGEEITVQWTETIDHPGYFRIALAENRADLKDPTVPFTSASNCNVDHSKIPTGPHDNVLADGVFLVDNASSRPNYPNYTYKVKLPNKPCEKCTLQVLQFMEQHPPSCIYYHCADIKIVASGGALDAGIADAGKPDAGAPSVADAATTPDSSSAGGVAGGAAGGATPGAAGGGNSPVGTAGGAGGTTGATVGTAGGTTGSTGATAGAGGTGTTTGSATPGTPTSNDDDGGCSVSFGRGRSSTAWAGLALFGLAVLGYRRQRNS